MGSRPLNPQRVLRDLVAPFPVRPRGVQRISNVAHGDAGKRNLMDLYRRRASMAALTPNHPAFQPADAEVDTTVAAAICLTGTTAAGHPAIRRRESSGVRRWRVGTGPRSLHRD